MAWAGAGHAVAPEENSGLQLRVARWINGVMPPPRLEVEGQFYRLREIGKQTFVPDEPATFLGNGTTALTSKLVVCVSTRNCEPTIGAALEKLEKQLGAAQVKFIIGDNGSTDNTPAAVGKWCEKQPADFLFSSFAHEADEGRAMGRLVSLANMLGLDRHQVCVVRLETDERPHRIGSFAMVATVEVAEEAAFLIRSLRTFHAEPIFVLCDKPTRQLIQKQGDDGVQFKEGASKRTLAQLDKRFRKHVTIGNDFHRVDCIAAKMDALEWAIQEAGDTLFLDADIVAVANLNEGFAHELMLGPHFHGENPFESARKYGLVNAGYLWTNNLEVPEMWREIYLGRSAFFEQEGMPLLLEKFSTGFFPPSHNVGFWRRPEFPAVGIKSWHVHMTDALDEKANVGLRAAYQEHRALVTENLSQIGRFDLLDFLKELTQ